MEMQRQRASLFTDLFVFDWDAVAPHEAGKHFKLKMFIGLSWQCTETEKSCMKQKDDLTSMTHSEEGQKIAVSGFMKDNQGKVRLNTQGQTPGRRAGDHRSRKTQ